MSEKQLYIVEISIYLYGHFVNNIKILILANSEKIAIQLAIKATELEPLKCVLNSVIRLCDINESNTNSIISILE